MVKAVVGLVRADGSFEIPAHGRLGAALGVGPFCGIRTPAVARRHLDDQPDLATIIFASATTKGAARHVGLAPTDGQVGEVEAEYAARNPTPEEVSR